MKKFIIFSTLSLLLLTEARAANGLLAKCIQNLRTITTAYNLPIKITVTAPSGSLVHTDPDVSSVVTREAELLVQLLDNFSPYVVVSPHSVLHISDEMDPFKASAMYLARRVNIPLGLLAHPEDSLVAGIIGHEAGHLIFTESMRELLSELVSKQTRSNLLEQLKNVATDRTALQTEFDKLIRLWPSLSRETMLDGSVNAYAFFRHRLLKGILEAKPDDPILNAPNDKVFIELFVNHHLAGYSEVVADVLGAVHSKDPSWARFLPAKVDQKARDFAILPQVFMQLVMEHPEMMEAVVQQVANGGPHILHIFERAKIFELFYRSKGRSIGENHAYDARVTATYMESIAGATSRIWEKVLQPKAPRVGSGAAALALTLTMKDISKEVEQESLTELAQRSMALDKLFKTMAGKVEVVKLEFPDLSVEDLRKIEQAARAREASQAQTRPVQDVHEKVQEKVQVRAREQHQHRSHGSGR